MKISNITLILLALFIDSFVVVHADPVTVNITGKVIASPCIVDTVNSDLNVNLGDIEASTMSNSGQVSTIIPFQVVLKSCPAATSNATVSFSGTEDTAAPGRYLNTGVATNVAVEVLQNGVLIPPGSNINQVVQSDRTVIYSLQSRAYAKSQVTPGSIIATVQMTFSYQ